MSESFEAIASGVHLEASAWNYELQQFGNIPEPENRGFILTNISAGMEALWQLYAPADSRPPMLAIPKNLLEGSFAENEGRLCYMHSMNIIIATRTWLDRINRAPTNKIVSFRGLTNEVAHEGRLSDLCFLNGCEEADHALWQKEGRNVAQAEPINRMQSLASYDATPIEFRALERQLEIATTLSMPVITLGILRQRIENARKIMQAIR